MQKTKSAFISYSSVDGFDPPFDLKNYLQAKNIDVFCDIDCKKNNSSSIIDVIKQQVVYKENLILLFTIASAKRLIKYGKSSPDSHNIENLNYTYEELKTALEHNKNIIPVCVEPTENDFEIKKLMRILFRECFSCNDSYSYIYIEPNQNKDSFFHNIYNRITFANNIQHPDLSNVYWVGTRESDMPLVKSGKGFKGCISLFGEKNDKKNIVMCESGSGIRVDHNDSTDTQQDEFIIQSITQVLKNDPNAKFMFYNPSAIYRLNLTKIFGYEHFLCLNNENILAKVNNKRNFRELVKDVVPLIPILERSRSDCDYYDLLEAKNRGEFNDNNNYSCKVKPIEYDEDLKFIIQAPVASGGDGTFILTQENAQSIFSALDKKAGYLVSVYHTRSIPVNIHAIIYNDNILFSPGSVQLMREVATENKLLYKGADFIAYHQISVDLRNQFENQARSVAQRLKEIGYRGVCGIDAIIHDGRVNIMEVNGRFQASTELINRALLQNGAKSIQEMNLEAFDNTYHSDFEEITPNHNIAFSNYTYSYEGKSMHDSHIYTTASKSNQVVKIQSDGFVPDHSTRYIAQAYLYRLVFRSNIASINEDGAVLINENICTPSKWLIRQIKSKDKLTIKLALMMLGIRIENDICKELREATNNAVDLQFSDGEDIMVINSPTNIKYVEFSPFSLHSSYYYNGKFCVYYYGQPLLDNIGVFPIDNNQNLKLKDGKHTFSEIAYLSTDRLRVHLTNACCYKLENSLDKVWGNGCKFCNIDVNNNPNLITPQDIKEVVDKYIKDRSSLIQSGNIYNRPILRHFLLGGQSRIDSNEVLIETAKILQRYRMPIYAMTLPLDEETIKKLIEHEVLEFAFNIEIFNPGCRIKYMPGKGRIPIEKYFKALITARKILNGINRPTNRKVVRSMIVVGLEPYKDLLDGIKVLIDNQIEPMLSIFRPLPNTPLEDLNAPTIRSMYELFFTVSRMLFNANDSKGRNFRKLGPECSCCQNNTVSLPWHFQTEIETCRLWSIDNNKEKFKE